MDKEKLTVIMDGLTIAQKELIFKFHVKMTTMTNVANELNVRPLDAYDVYQASIFDIIREFRKKNYVDIKFKTGKMEKDEPLEPDEEATEDVVLMDDDADEDEPEVEIQKKVIDGLLKDDLPVIIEDGEHAKAVAMFLVDDDEDSVAIIDELDGDLPSISVVPKKLIKKVKEPFILVIPTFDEDSNTVGVEIERLEEE